MCLGRCINIYQISFSCDCDCVVVNPLMTVPESSCFGDAKFFPPGFRFHPTDEELILYYLKRKICRQRLKLDIIGETDVYKWDPEDLPGLSKLKTGDRQWFFFSPRDRKYPNGARSNRATMHGYWKTTGKDRTISCNLRSVGLKKTLVYYKGRAPSGERTDWVMHEYTLDEEELKRCLSAKDYYALYKVYKKSGPGPKNGEQYGAPFVEEDWADDDCVSFNADQVNSVKEANVSCVDNNRANDQQQCLLNDLEELLNQIVDEPVPTSPLDVDYTHALDQLIGVEENASTLVDHSSRETNLPEGSMVLHQSQQYNVQACFDYTNSATSQLQLYEASEVTSAPNICEQKLGENFLEDFLEMDDLIVRELTVQNFGKQPEPLSFDEIDGLTDLDLYNDENMFLCDMVPGEQGQISQPYENNLESGMVNVAPNSYLNNENGEVNHQMEPYRNDANLMSSQLWMEDENYIFNPAEANEAAVSQQISGAECNDNLGNVFTGATQNQSVKVGTDSWFSSALWAFVESIPTTTASASESALVNRAFERMSSFGRVRINTGKTNDAAGNLGTTSKRSGNFKGGMLCFSVLGIFCAILWWLIAISMKLGKYIFS